MSACVQVASVNIARRMRDKILPRPHGFTHAASCGCDTCVTPEHVELRKWKAYKPPNGNPLCPKCGRRSFKTWTGQMEQFRRGKALASRRQQYVCAWGCTFYAGPFLRDKMMRFIDVNGLRPGCFWLGLMDGVSLHADAIPKYEHCKVKACAFPANGNGQHLCRHHFHFFDRLASMMNGKLDINDLFAPDNRGHPTFWTAWMWEEKFAFQDVRFDYRGCSDMQMRKTSDSWWTEHVLAAEQRIKTGIVHGIAGLHHGQGPSKSKHKRSSRKAHKAHVANKVGGKHPEDKPRKRWSRESVESETAMLSPSRKARTSELDHLPIWAEVENTRPMAYVEYVEEMDEMTEREILSSNLQAQQREFEEIFNV